MMFLGHTARGAPKHYHHAFLAVRGIGGLDDGNLSQISQRFGRLYSVEPLLALVFSKGGQRWQLQAVVAKRGEELRCQRLHVADAGSENEAIIPIKKGIFEAVTPIMNDDYPVFLTWDCVFLGSAASAGLVVGLRPKQVTVNLNGNKPVVLSNANNHEVLRNRNAGRSPGQVLFALVHLKQTISKWQLN